MDTSTDKTSKNDKKQGVQMLKLQMLKNITGKSSTAYVQREQQQKELSPLVYWAQNEYVITLKVDLKDSELPKLEMSPTSIKFMAIGYGARGRNLYKFDLKFYGSIDEDESQYQMLDTSIQFFLRKSEEGWWPRLVATPQKPHWLKVDFDRWQSTDEVCEEAVRDIRGDYEEEYEKLQKEELGYIKESGKKVYMIFYNLAQFIGYLYILCVLSIIYYRDGLNAIPKGFETAGNAMKFCQLLQFLEVLHPIFGYTKGSALIPFFQVAGRNFVLFEMIDKEERMHAKPVVFYVFVIWSLVEIIRYPYYISQLLKRENGLLTWLRYTVWIPLYPLGILCEGVIILRNIPYFEETKRLTVEMPNQWNFAFHMPTFLKLYLLILILPGTYFLMTHMAKLRAKKLATKHKRHEA